VEPYCYRPVCLHDINKHNSNTEWLVLGLSYGAAGTMNIVGLIRITKKGCFLRLYHPNTYV